MTSICLQVPAGTFSTIRRTGLADFDTKVLAMTLPEIATYDEWHTARVALLAEEKAMTKARDALSTKRRMLPMVRVEKDYKFDGPNGPASLLDMFEGRTQLIIQHFMFDPAWEDGCSSCTASSDELSDGLLRHLVRQRHHVRRGLACSARQARALQAEARLDISVVLVVRQRLQLRLSTSASMHRWLRSSSTSAGPKS